MQYIRLCKRLHYFLIIASQDTYVNAFYIFFFKLTLTRSFLLLYSAVMLPPIFSVNSLAMDSPSPVDPPPTVSTVKKRSKSRSVSTQLNAPASLENKTVPFVSSATVRSPSEYRE